MRRPPRQPLAVLPLAVLPLAILPVALLAACGGSFTAAPAPSTSSAAPAVDQAKLVIGVATTFNSSLLDGDGATACAQLTAKAQTAFVATFVKNAGLSGEQTCPQVVSAIHAQLSADEITKGKKFVVAKAVVSGQTATIADADVTVDGVVSADQNPLPATFLLVDGVWKLDNLG